MHFIPFVIGKVKLDMTRVEFVERLVELTEGDYPLIPPYEPLTVNDYKEYSREVYDNSFLLWKTKKPFRKSLFFFTTAYVRLIDEPDDTISIRYLIRFTFIDNVFGTAILAGMAYAGFAIKPYFLLFGLSLYIFWLLLFSSMASDDKAFLRILTKEIDIGN